MEPSNEEIKDFLELNPSIYSDFYDCEEDSIERVMEKFNTSAEFNSHVIDSFHEAGKVRAEDEQAKREAVYG